MKSENQSFDDRCYALLKRIPKGKVTTYSEIARALNSKAYRAVGNAMAKNKNLVVVPCHRVIRSDGDIGNYAGGRNKKLRLLKDEGVSIKNGKVENVETVIHRF